MGFAGMKIPGHSGTDFKNKKVYAKAKKRLNEQPIYTDVRLEQRETKPTYPWFKKIKILFVFTLISIFLILIGGFSYRISELNTGNKIIEKKSSLSLSEKHRAAVVMLNSARYYYDAKEYDEAQNEITRVLHLYPHDLESIELMHKILSKQCQLKSKFCSDAKDYQNYLERVKKK